MFDVQIAVNKAVLSWPEIRANAARFAKDWEDAHYEKGETQSFYNDFFTAFGQRRRDVAVYERKVRKLNNNAGFIDLFWPGKLLVEQKSAGLSLEKASAQATDYFLTLQEYEKPRYILLSDFQTFELIDLETRKKNAFHLYELPQKVELFDFIAGYHQQKYKDQDPANIVAMDLMSSLHLKLEKCGYRGSDLERLLVRIMFCLFADNTGIFPLQSFLRYVDDRRSRDIGPLLIQIFQVLDTPPEMRQTTLDEDLVQLPYVNGLLFSDPIKSPSFDESMYAILLQCCYFDWSKVSPALFGSLFQTVMLPEKQRKSGAHYTSERNILKTIHPLFLDELREEFGRIKNNRSTQRQAQLEKFHAKLGSLTFLDPACGCGNFLILAYRELRLLELEVLRALFPTPQLVLDVKQLSKIDVDQFYGIEIEEFPVRIAEAAMWLMDHQMNMELSHAFGQNFVRLPLKKSVHIVNDNALRINWKTVVPPEHLDYILSNPPFAGKSYQEKIKKEDMSIVFGETKSAGLLDYVAAWYWKTAKYIQGTNIKVAFVSTNSIVQGEQVGALWQPLLAEYGVRINFAHRTFKWTIDGEKTKNMKVAAVHAVIIGFALYDEDRKYLFAYESIASDPKRIDANNINPYLADAANIIVNKRSTPLCDSPKILYGSKPVDGGFFILNEEEKASLLKSEPLSAKWIKEFIGTDEFLYDLKRYCLWLPNADPSELKKCRNVLSRIDEVRKYRLTSPKVQTQKAAKTPTLFTEIRQPKSRYLAIPEVSSENRTYIPIGYLDKDVIASNLIYTVANASAFHFGVLTSMMHMVWVNYMCGRLESRPRYSSSLCYNSFPWPQNTTPAKIKEIEEKARAVLDIRTGFPDSTLADLYGTPMPPILIKAHQALGHLDKLIVNF